MNSHPVTPIQASASKQGFTLISFADGHSEIHKWKDPRTMPVLKRGTDLPLNVNSPNNQDALWLMERATRRR